MRHFRASLSEKKNQLLLKRAHELDALLIKCIGEVRDAAEAHAWRADGIDDLVARNGYLNQLKQPTQAEFKHHVYDDSDERGVPFEAVAPEAIFLDLSEDHIEIGSRLAEAEARLNALAKEEEEEHGDNQPEQ